MAMDGDAKNVEVTTDLSPDPGSRQSSYEGSTRARLAAVDEANNRIEFLLAQLLMAEEAAKLDLVQSVEQTEREQERAIVLDPVTDPDLEHIGLETVEDDEPDAESEPIVDDIVRDFEEEELARADVDEPIPSDAEPAESESDEDVGASDVAKPEAEGESPALDDVEEPTPPDVEQVVVDEGSETLEDEDEAPSIAEEADEPAAPQDVNEPPAPADAEDSAAEVEVEEPPAPDDIDEPSPYDTERVASRKANESSTRLKREAMIPELDIPDIEEPEEPSEMSSQPASSRAADRKGDSSRRRVSKGEVLANKEHGARLEVGMSVMDDATSGRTRELQGRRKRMKQREGFFGSIGAFVVRVLHIDS